MKSLQFNLKNRQPASQAGGFSLVAATGREPHYIRNVRVLSDRFFTLIKGGSVTSAFEAFQAPFALSADFEGMSVVNQRTGHFCTFKNKDFCGKVRTIVTTNTIGDLEELRTRAFVLKQRFSETETRQWTPAIVASELVLQVTHLQYSLMTPDEKLEVYPTKGVDKGLGDELSDVFFNALNILSFLNLTLFDIEESMSTTSYKPVSGRLLVSNLVIQAANVWDNVARLEGYKHLDREHDDVFEQIKLGISGVIQSTLAIATYHEIDMMRATTEMFLDAEKFLNNYQN